MPRKKKAPLSFVERILKIKKAGLTKEKGISTLFNKEDCLLPLSERIQKLLGLFGDKRKKTNRMLYFIMYDIENNKIRTYIAKYLIDKGCVRVQKSIFLADTDRGLFKEISQNLKDVQEAYDNDDSIFFVPVSSDEIRAMKIIGQSVDFDYFLESPNTMIF